MLGSFRCMTGWAPHHFFACFIHIKVVDIQPLIFIVILALARPGRHRSDEFHPLFYCKLHILIAILKAIAPHQLRQQPVGSQVV